MGGQPQIQTGPAAVAAAAAACHRGVKKRWSGGRRVVAARVCIWEGWRGEVRWEAKDAGGGGELREDGWRPPRRTLLF